MSGVVVNDVRRGFYLDSVALMRLSSDLAALEGVEDAVAMSGTPSNLDIMREAGLLAAPGEAAGPNDLVVAVRAAERAVAEGAIAHAAAALEGGSVQSEEARWRPRTLDGALERMGDANLALISTPGVHAAREARRALDRGLNVMMFSDNVSPESERALKERAQELGLLVMGPDCGTAYIAGTPLAFANVVPRGRVGVISASGTGLQEVAVLLGRAGAGHLHGIGWADAISPMRWAASPRSTPSASLRRTPVPTSSSSSPNPPVRAPRVSCSNGWRRPASPARQWSSGPATSWRHQAGRSWPRR